MSSLVLGILELDTEVQVGSHQNEGEGQNPLLSPAAHTGLNAAQGTAFTTSFLLVNVQSLTLSHIFIRSSAVSCVR